MMGPIARYLADDHARLEALLTRGATDPAAYADFRRGLLRHIGMEEEEILLPAAQRTRGGEPLPAAARLRLDHGALAALVPTPPGHRARCAAFSSTHARRANRHLRRARTSGRRRRRDPVSFERFPGARDPSTRSRGGPPPRPRASGYALETWSERHLLEEPVKGSTVLSGHDPSRGSESARRASVAP
jgi:hypothetical protein